MREKKEILTKTVKIDWLAISEHGHSNGYIGVPKGHVWYGKHYDDIECDVHGGLTFGKQGEDSCILKISLTITGLALTLATVTTTNIIGH